MEYPLAILLPDPNPLQIYSLIFLLGSLSVSSLSDIRRLAAQTDFAEVWGAFAVFMFFADVYLGMSAELGLLAFLLKWSLIAAFTLLTSGNRLSICTMDIAAVIALLSALTPAYIIGALILALIVNEFLKPILKNYAQAGAYPFLPTVLIVNLLVLFIIVAGGIEPYIGV
jgi:hypothetical protein